MTTLKTWQCRIEAALVITATVAMLAAPFIVANAIGDRDGGPILVGFLGILAGFTLAVAAIALDGIRTDVRRAGQR